MNPQVEPKAVSEISILGLSDDNLEQDDQEGARGWNWGRADQELTRSPITTEKLRSNLTEFLRGMQAVVSTVPEHLGGFHLSEVTLSAEVSASGRVSLMGVGGAEVGGQGGITFTLVRTSTGAQSAPPKVADADAGGAT